MIGRRGSRCQGCEPGAIVKPGVQANMTIMRLLMAFSVLLSLVVPAFGGALAEGRPGRLTYAAYVAGLRVFELEVALDVARDRYRVDLAYRTAGVLGAVVSGGLRSVSQGRFVAGQVAPSHLSVDGEWRGKPRRTEIDYIDAIPVVRVLEPPSEEEREVVPAALQRGTVDSVGSVLALLRQLEDGRGCDGARRVFDGRRLSEIAATGAGQEVLEPTGRSSFSGPTTRCDFQGRLLAGFMLADDRARAARPQSGSAWMARVLPNAPPLPVRMVFDARWLGHVTMYLTSVTPG